MVTAISFVVRQNCVWIIRKSENFFVSYLENYFTNSTTRMTNMKIVQRQLIWLQHFFVLCDISKDAETATWGERRPKKWKLSATHMLIIYYLVVILPKASNICNKVFLLFGINKHRLDYLQSMFVIGIDSVQERQVSSLEKVLLNGIKSVTAESFLVFHSFPDDISIICVEACATGGKYGHIC